MFDFLYEGGPVFTFPLTLLLIVAVILVIKNIISGSRLSKKQSLRNISYIKYLGILAITLGLLGQVIGLYGAFDAIQQMENVSAEMFYGGMKVSSITTIYGLAIFLLCFSAWLIMKLKTERSS